MIDRLSLLGGLSKYICIYHNDGPRSLIGRLSRALEFRPLLFMIDRPRLLGGLSIVRNEEKYNTQNDTCRK